MVTAIQRHIAEIDYELAFNIFNHPNKSNHKWIQFNVDIANRNDIEYIENRLNNIGYETICKYINKTIEVNTRLYRTYSPPYGILMKIINEIKYV